MAEYGTWDNRLLMLQTVNEFVDILNGIETETVHTRIELDVYGPACDTLFASSLNQCIHQSEGVDLRLQIVVEHRLESRHLRIHNHDVGGDASLTERHTLIGHSHCEIIDTMVLQRLGNLNGTCAIGISLDHTHHLRLGLQERAIVVEILHNGIEIHLKDGLVNLLLQLFRNLVETKRTGSLQQDELIAQSCKSLTGEEMGYVDKELLVSYLYLICLSSQFRTNADKLVDTTFHSQLRHLSIQGIRRCTSLEYIAENQGLFKLRVES